MALANKCEDIVNLQGAEAYCVATCTACQYCVRLVTTVRKCHPPLGLFSNGGSSQIREQAEFTGNKHTYKRLTLYIGNLQMLKSRSNH